MVDKTKIDLACGDSKKEGYFGIDTAAIDGVDCVHDLNVFPWPLEDNSVEDIYCNHYVEHIPHDDWQSVLKESSSFQEFKEKALKDPKDGLIKFMNEVYRILKPDGKIIITVPHLQSTRAFWDPTHVRFLHDVSFYYFNKEWRDTNKISHYGIEGNFDISFSYLIDDELMLKSDDVRNKAYKEDWNSIKDLIVELIKIK
jgi:predicted SAM-dependent methyltransferase